MENNKRRNFFRMFGFVKPFKFRYAISLIVYTCQNFVSTFIISFFMGQLMAAIIGGEMSGVYDALLRLIILLVIFCVAVAVGVYVYVVTIARGDMYMREQIFSAFVRGSLETSTAKHSGEGIAAINTDADAASDVFGTALASLLFNVQAIAGSVVAIFVIDYRMGLGVIGIGIITFAIQASFAPALSRLGTARLETNAQSVKAMSSIFSGGLAIRALARQQKAWRVFDVENGKLKAINLKEAFISMWQSMFTTVQGWLTTVLVFALGGYFVATGSMYLHTLVMIPMMAMAITGAMSTIGSNWAGLQPPIVAAGRVFAILDSVPPEEAVKEHAPWDGQYEINLQGINFAYQNAEENALTDISLEIGENEMVAFVGPSGSGKSTLLKLIIGMYQRPGLEMNVGNLNFTDGDMADWREHFAYVDQSCKLFDMTIGENIAMGKKGEATDEEIRQAAKEAFADDFIEALPDGYDSDCGEKGASLSGGQRQRIAIASALAKLAPVMVFDEATSALDSESEQRIMESIETFRQNHTILITTHNLSNVVSADKIVVMDGGYIVETGTHAELMAKNGVYAGLAG